MKLNPVESAVSGSQAFEVGTMTMTLPGGTTDRGKYVRS